MDITLEKLEIACVSNEFIPDSSNNDWIKLKTLETSAEELAIDYYKLINYVVIDLRKIKTYNTCQIVFDKLLASLKEINTSIVIIENLKVFINSISNGFPDFFVFSDKDSFFVEVKDVGYSHIETITLNQLDIIFELNKLYKTKVLIICRNRFDKQYIGYEKSIYAKLLK